MKSTKLADFSVFDMYNFLVKNKISHLSNAHRKGLPLCYLYLLAITIIIIITDIIISCIVDLLHIGNYDGEWNPKIRVVFFCRDKCGPVKWMS